MDTRRKLFAIILTCTILFSRCQGFGSTALKAERGDVNLDHLNFLVEDVEIAGQPMGIIHIYSEYPKYDWVDASGEGIACVDDAARAAIVYLNDYELTGDKKSLDKAKRLLNFVLYMQAEDGEFYNFIYDRQGTINKTGNTSYKSAGWWAVRGAWALGVGYRVLKEKDKGYAKTLELAFQRIRDVWAVDVTQKYGKYSQVHGINVPAWLIMDAADISSVAVLALLEYDQAVEGSDTTTRDLIEKLSEGLSIYQSGDHRNYPFALHPDSSATPFSWHAWGSVQSFALAKAGKQLNHPEWVASAKREADSYFARLLAGTMVNEWGVLPFEYAQIAYGINSITQGLLVLKQATGDDTYSKMAGLIASWFYGNNPANFAMYDPTTGRGYDGLQGPSSFRVNKNSGSESTIEAIMALQAIALDPVASKYLHYTLVQDAGISWDVLEAENAMQVQGDAVESYKTAISTGEAKWSNQHYILIGQDDRFEYPFSIPANGNYYLYSAYLRQGQPREGFSIQAALATTSPVIDGELGEWKTAQPLNVNTTNNILRGAANWGGPEKDAFTGYVMWDADNLYIAVEVFSPSFHQEETGPSVWKGDVLWVYFNPIRESSTVDQKLTLAQTPDGPQVWHWKANTYLPGAELVWKQGEGSYIYEVALPWKSMNVNQVEVGREMGLELGRGCCVTGFQDLTGSDPDVAANLVKMVLVEEVSTETATQEIGVVGPDAVALNWEIDGRGLRSQLHGGSPDRDYLWLERLNTTLMDLSAGEHILTLTYGGADPNRSVAVDGFLIMPAQLTKKFTSQEGELTLIYDIDQGSLSFEENLE